MKKFLLLLVSLLIVQLALSQGEYIENDTIKKYPKAYLHNYITWSPLALMEIEPSLQLGYMYKVGENKMLHHEIAYVGLMNGMYELSRRSNWDWPENVEFSSYGFRFRTNFRKYLSDKENDGKYKYIGVDAMYKYMNITEGNYRISRMNGNYFELYDVNWQKSVAAIHFMYGSTSYLSVINNIIIDSYLGIGIRNKFLTDNVPNDANVSPIWYDDTFNAMIVSVMMGFKIGFGT